MEVLRELEEYAGITTEGAITIQRNLTSTDIAVECGECCVSVLIDPSSDHPGAGACIVDDAVSEVELEELRWLREILPVSGCDETGGGDDVKSPRGSIRDEGGGRIYEYALDKSAYQPSRRYFCNADGSVAAMLKGCVDAVRVGLRLS